MPRTTNVPAPVQRTFELSLRVDAHSEAFVDSDEEAVGGVTHGAMVPGDTVTWRTRHYFVDQQQRGPFKRFRHEHHFAPGPNNSTVMTDHVEFEAPLEILGGSLSEPCSIGTCRS